MRQFGPFELTARLGRGGSAEVWRATLRGPHGFSRAVALKRLLPSLASDPRVRQALLDEARLASALRHPNIAQVLDVVEVNGEHAIVMELVDGCDLRTLARTLEAPRDPGLGAYLVGEVARALEAAHRRRPPILHRDVSANNVLVDRTGAVKLADFGIARALDSLSSTGTASIRGNLAYMAPEQLMRQAISPASDVYGAGVLLWELLTGRRLFPLAFEADEMARARRQAAPPPSSVNPRVPAALDAVCAKAMALDASERFADGGALAAALAPLAHELAFGPTQLARLVADVQPAPTLPTDRVTVTEAPSPAANAKSPTANAKSPTANASATDVRSTPARAGRARARKIAIAVAAASLGAATMVSLSHRRAPAAPAPSAAVAAAPIHVEPLPNAEPVPSLAPLPIAHAAAPVKTRRPLAPRRSDEAPDFVRGKLVNPFPR